MVGYLHPVHRIDVTCLLQKTCIRDERVCAWGTRSYLARLPKVGSILEKTVWGFSLKHVFAVHVFAVHELGVKV